MDPASGMIGAALISGLAGGIGGALNRNWQTEQAEEERKRREKELREAAIQRAMEMQASTIQQGGQGVSNAYSNMLNAYRGIL